MKIFYQIVILGLILLNSACSSLSQYSNVTGQLIIAEPVEINYKSEIALARMSEVIQRADITDEQRAQLFYDRGVIYDSVGLRSLARLDFNRALRLKPDLVDAYNFLGIHYTQLQEYTQAYDSLDSAIELDSEHEFAYLNRGIALYYGGRPSLAVEDLKAFYQHRIDDPYRALWLFLAEREISNEQALASLEDRAENISDKMWAKQIINLYLGKISQDKFMNILSNGVQTNKELSDRLCEAYFYLGKINQINGNNHDAANFYKLALSTNVFEFVEHRYAKLELDILRENTVNQPL
ncbi:lipoprotein NlpI [Thalassotalea profundi]|uniref:Lipoprotein NlpI n=1 Tax=Thalassotalea profundi TaxID=2036687 RepID=A0ABQ3ICW5_9GAMM|nr:lipoprotein NlpI [Thalassotalea profundi]GHE78843.1 lipoprotein NlpI [Thalassotalea profundi]